MVKSWVEKLHDSKDLPKTVKLNPKGAMHWHGETMIIPSPLEVDKIMKTVPKGELITIDGIRKKLAKKYKTDIACPLTTGIFAWISANAAEEEASLGKTKTTPYWRTLKTKGELNSKYPGGIENQKKLIETEGHKVIQKGKKFFVENYQEKNAY